MIEKFEKDLNKYYGKLDKQSKVSAKDVAKANTGENNKGVNTVQDAEQKTEAYHADKAAGKETELVKAVEEAIGKNKEPISEPTNKVKGVSSNSNEGNSALRDVESTAKALEGLAMGSPRKIIEAAKSIDKIEYVEEQEARDIIESYTHYKSGNQKSPATR